MKRNLLIRNLASVTRILLTVAALAWLAVPAPAADPETVVATTRMGTITVEDIQRYARYGGVPNLRRVPFQRIPDLPASMLTEAARFIAGRREAAGRVPFLNDPATVQQVRKPFEQLAPRLIAMHVASKELSDRITTPTQEQVQQYYEEHKDQFFQPFHFYMRHLIRFTYEPYVVQEGDTLESIAKKVSGDPAQVDNIRADVEGRPPRREEGKDFRPLEPGETLWVPMGEQAAAAVHRDLEQKLDEMRTSPTMTFADLTARYSESSYKDEVIGPLPSGTRPMLQELIDMGDETPVGELSPIFRTKHGWQVIEVVDKQDAGYKPLHEVRDRIEANLLWEKRQRAFQDFIDRIYENPALEVDYEAFGRGESLTADEVVIRVGDERIQWGAIAETWRTNARPTQPDAVLKLLKQVQPLQFALIQNLARPTLNDPTSDLSRELSEQEQLMVGEQYLSEWARARAHDALTTEAVESYYEENKATMFKLPLRLHYVVLERQLTPEQQELEGAPRDAALEQLTARLADDLAGIDGAGAFLDKAAQLAAAIPNPTGQPPRYDTGEPVAVNTIPKPIRERIRDMEAGERTEPFVMDDTRAVSVMVLERLEPGIAPLAGVFEQAAEALVKQLTRSELQAAVEEVLRDTQYNVVMQTGPGV